MREIWILIRVNAAGFEVYENAFFSEYDAEMTVRMSRPKNGCRVIEREYGSDVEVWGIGIVKELFRVKKEIVKIVPDQVK